VKQCAMELDFFGFAGHRKRERRTVRERSRNRVAYGAVVASGFLTGWPALAPA
jgi:hypothetical protein